MSRKLHGYVEVVTFSLGPGSIEQPVTNQQDLDQPFTEEPCETVYEINVLEPFLTVAR